MRTIPSSIMKKIDRFWVGVRKIDKSINTIDYKEESNSEKTLKSK